MAQQVRQVVDHLLRWVSDAIESQHLGRHSNTQGASCVEAEAAVTVSAVEQEDLDTFAEIGRVIAIILVELDNFHSWAFIHFLALMSLHHNQVGHQIVEVVLRFDCWDQAAITYMMEVYIKQVLEHHTVATEDQVAAVNVVAEVAKLAGGQACLTFIAGFQMCSYFLK